MKFTKTIQRVYKKRFSSLGGKRKVYYKKTVVFVRRKPVTSFLVLLGLLFLLIILSNVLSKPKAGLVETTPPVKEVSIYNIGKSPKIQVQAQVEKSGVIKIVALGPGVVQSVSVHPGTEVSKGDNLVAMSTNYQGGNAFSVQRQIAYVNYKNAKDTYGTQKDLIQKQRELAQKSDENSDQLREVSSKSIDETKSLISLNDDILNTLSQNQANFEATNSAGMNDSLILSTKQLRSQLSAANLQLSSALRNTEFSSSGSNPPAKISDVQKDIALKQLDIQEKALALSKEVARLNFVLAQINEGIMFPSAPFSGVVDRVYVKEGQAVVPGTPLVQLAGDTKSLIAVAFLSGQMARSISRSDLSTLKIGDQTYETAPFYVSEEATDGQLYAAFYTIPDNFNSQVSDKGYIIVEIPIGFPQTGSAIPFVPLDAIFQTQDEAFLFVAKNGRAESRKVTLGLVLGRFVEVKSGLGEGDQVILNRNVIQGDLVKSLSQ